MTLRSLKDSPDFRPLAARPHLTEGCACAKSGAHFRTMVTLEKMERQIMSYIVSGFTCAALACCLLSQPLHAGDAAFGNLVITQAWSRATPGGARVAGGYLTIENRGTAPERLLSGSTELARKLEIHTMAVDKGVMTMRPVEDGLTIASGGSVTFAPGGYHLMFVDLNAPLRQGEQVPVTLTFERAGEIKALFDVQGMGAQSPAAPGIPEAEKTTAAPVVPGDDESFFTHLHAEKAMANVTVSPGRAGPVEIAIQLENADELPLTAKAVTVTLGNSESGIAPVTVDAEQVSNDQWRVRMSAPVAGRWSLGLGITITASDTVNVVSPILIR
jgi:copper(I)-binding protein